MTALTQSILRTDMDAGRIDAGQVSKFTASEIRFSIAELVAQNNLPLAEALADAGLSLYPKHEEMLAIASLLAEVRQDWASAATLLEQLVRLQGASAPLATCLHWVRVLRCHCEPLLALQAVEHALHLHPGDAALDAEKTNLLALIPSISSMHATRDAA
jgi:hypothetical protein